MLCQRNSIIAASNLLHFHRLILSQQIQVVCLLLAIFKTLLYHIIVKMSIFL